MSAKKILIIEDDPAAAEAVLEKVRSAGFSGIVTHTSAEGLRAFHEQQPDLIVLDLMLPDGDGIELCRTIRKQSQVPIIMLTARAEETDRIMGLEIGADDYVTKPFSPKELVSRIKAVLRRSDLPHLPLPPSSTHQGLIYTAGDIRLDAARREVTINGKPVRLTPTEYAILHILIQNAGQVVSRDTLINTIWQYNGFSANLLEIHIGNLRRKIEENPRYPRRLITLRSFGYKIAS